MTKQTGAEVCAEDARLEAFQKVSNLFETHLNCATPQKSEDLWKEHLLIRECLDEVQKLQDTLADTSSLLLDKRSKSSLEYFNKWAKQIGIQYDGVEIAQWTQRDFQLRARKEIKKDEPIVVVPHHAMISYDLVKKSSMLKKAVELDPILKSMDNVALALFLSGHRLRSDSKWIAYLDMLPTSFSTPLYYSEEELLALKPSPAFDEALTFYRTISRQFCYFFLQFGKNDLYNSLRKRRQFTDAPPPFYNSPFTVENFTFDLYRWAVCIISTRVNMVPSQTRKDKQGNPVFVPVLIPVLDMANHEYVEATSVSYVAETESGEISASRDYKIGEVITIDYGRRTNADHLLYNGFVPAENPSNSYKLKIALPRSDRLFRSKAKVLLDMDCVPWLGSNLYIFDIVLDEIPFGSTLVDFILVFLSDDPMVQIEQDTKSHKKVASFLKTRFALLERTYAMAKELKSPNSAAILRLKAADLQILEKAREYCEEWEKVLAVEEKSS
ncbi:unnamed protein product [Auanema sp. JU1783]|nr:unnamed protein product [Auanema sp. JU1783]